MVEGYREICERYETIFGEHGARFEFKGSEILEVWRDV